MIASVAGKISAAPMPISARPVMSASGESGGTGERGCGAEGDEPHHQRPLAPELVAEPAAREQAGR